MPVRSDVATVRPSGEKIAELIQVFEARWSPDALDSHLEAGRRVDQVRRDAFQMIGERTRSGGAIEEFEVKQFVLDGFAKKGLITDHGPLS